MKKETLVQKIKQRFSNLPQDIAVVVIYKGKKYSICPDRFEGNLVLDRLTVEQIKPFYYGEIIEQQQELCGNPQYQFLTFRAEAPCDFFRFAFHCSENQEEIMFDSFQQAHTWNESHKGKLVAPSNLSLSEIKELMWKIADKYNILDSHVLIQTLDYPVFCGMRGRDTPC